MYHPLKTNKARYAASNGVPGILLSLEFWQQTGSFGLHLPHCLFDKAH